MGHAFDCSCPPCRYRRGEDLGQAPRLSVRLRSDVRDFLLSHAEGARGLIERLVDEERQGASRIRSLERQLALLQDQLITAEENAALPRQRSDSSQPSKLEELAGRMREGFRKHFQARSLARRLGLQGDKHFDTLGIGYCGARGVARGDFERKELSKLGLLAPNGREILAGCLTVPFFTTAGTLAGFWGCALNRSIERRTGHGLLATDPLGEELVLVDGVVEALAAFGSGVTNVQAMELLTPGWFPSLRQAGVRKIWLAVSQPDPSMTGELFRLGFDLWEVAVPEDRDSRTDLLELRPSWEAALKQAKRYEKGPGKKK